MLSSTFEVAASTMSTLLLLWSKSSTVDPCWITSISAPVVATTVLSSSTWVLARPMTWLEPLGTQIEPSLRSSRWAVYPVETIATVATSAAMTEPLVAVATSDL